jgi:hypothetical protein
LLTEGGEILHTAGGICKCRQSHPGRHLSERPGGKLWSKRLRERADLLLHVLDEGLRLATAGLHLTLRLTAVALHDARRLGATLTQLALHLGAGALDLAQRAVTSGVATALELAQVGRDATLDLAELALGARARSGVRLDGLDDLVARSQRCTDGDQDDALSLLLNGLDRVELGLGARLSGLASGTAALGGVAPARGSGLLGRRLPLCFGLNGHKIGDSPSRGFGTYR